MAILGFTQEFRAERSLRAFKELSPQMQTSCEKELFIKSRHEIWFQVIWFCWKVEIGFRRIFVSGNE